MKRLWHLLNSDYLAHGYRHLSRIRASVGPGADNPKHAPARATARCAERLNLFPLLETRYAPPS